MQASRHNIVSEIPGTNLFIVANLLSGEADLVSAGEVNGLTNPSAPSRRSLIEKGYLVDPAEEHQRYRMAYLDFLEQREEEELQLFFVPTYLCNFHCSYCYQAPYLSDPEVLSTGIIDAFFTYIGKQFAGRDKYITLFGGEPLLPGKAYKESISDFFNRCADHQLDVAVVTNGYHLSDYLEIFSRAGIREVQVTLDGPEEVHERRRPHKGGHKSFRRIANAIDQSLSLGYPVNLRMVVDRENIHSLPGLASFAAERGWTSSPLFKTQLGRNYELHHCHSGPQKIYSRLSLYQDLYPLIVKHPEILDFHKPAFSVARFLHENGQLPPPLFDACPACKTEWAFDHRGNIYSCTATVGKPGEELGRFHPTPVLYGKKIADWQQRDVLSIRECNDCNLQLACGGGCGSVAKNSQGGILKPDCRPVGELLGMGTALYGGNNLSHHAKGSV